MLKYNIILGIVLTTAGFGLLIFRPNRNHFLGYRTPRSIRDPESWNVANGMASRYLIAIGVATIILDVLNYHSVQAHFTDITLVTIALLVLAVVRIERRLWVRQRQT